MKRSYKILRLIVVSLLCVTVGIPLLLYLLLWLNPVRERLRTTAEQQLTELLGAQVSIESLWIEPFARVGLSNASVVDSAGGDTILSVGHIGCGVSISQLISSRRLVITDAELFAPRLQLYRATPESPLNVQPILDRLKSPDQEKKPFSLRLAVNTVVLRRGCVTYDVLSVAQADDGVFNPNHIHVSDLTADISAPAISAEEVTLTLKRLALQEECGLRIKDFHASLTMTDSLLCIDDVSTRFNSSHIALGSLRVPYPSPDRLIQAMLASPTSLEIKSGTEIYLSDLRHFVPQVPDIAQPVKLEALLSGVPDSIHVAHLLVDVPLADTRIMAQGTLLNLLNDKEAVVNRAELSAQINAPSLIPIIAITCPRLALKTAALAQCGIIDLHIEADGAPSDFDGALQLSSDAGSIEMNLHGAMTKGNIAISGNLNAVDLMPGALTQRTDIGNTTFSADFDGYLRGKNSALKADVSVDYLDWNNYTYSNIAATVDVANLRGTVDLDIDDPWLSLNATASLTDAGDDIIGLTLDTEIATINPARLQLWDKYPHHSFSGHLAANLIGTSIDTADGSLRLDRICLHNDSTDTDLRLSPILLTMHNSSTPQSLDLQAPMLTAWVTGEYSFRQVQNTVATLAATAVGLPQPASLPDNCGRASSLQAKVQIVEDEELAEFMHLPVRPLYPIILDATLSSADTVAAVNLRAPYLRKGDKLIRNTRLQAMFNDQGTSLLGGTLLETNRGDLNVELSSDVARGDGDLRLDWGIDNTHRRSEGALSLSFETDLQRKSATVNIRPTDMLFNDSVWHIRPAVMSINPEQISVNRIMVERQGQRAVIDGNISTDSTSTLQVALHDIDLDYLFETLNIGDAVMFGGTANGTVTASGLLGKSPMITTDNLRVANLSYGHCVMGDGNIRAGWMPESQGIGIDARIAQRNGKQSHIYGGIYPLSERLDLYFDADHAPMGFLHTFMNAFASEVGGEASGKAHLFGTFKLVDMTGDLYANDFSVRLAFTNVTYHATDSVHLRSGIVDINNLTIRDVYGNTATLNGALRHTHFKLPEFDFQVSNAHRLLVYDQPANSEERWYGRIFGNGTAYVKGRPGHIDIGANVVTTDNSEFTFVLTDALQAGEYSFLTLRDGTRHTASLDSLMLNPGSPQLDQVMFDKVRSLAKQEVASTYAMDINVDITPQARLTLVMDPVGGDKITAYGSGHANLLYNTANDDLRMFGNYNIARGDYLFTLQDIIIKKFTIAEGSTIAFHGNPYDAQLDISALYSLNANLLDLDQSFQTDKEVARTNVPVNAVLNVDGSMQQPDISFDLKFPTLTADVDRKVRSIISTDEMMNRQIIYLLALNKFYTPDYMASAAKGSELISVASSTISSQLSNILGQLSNKFTVAPSLRSDASNLSDMEFDIALSSTLLNNRLLLNGNLGYRDSQLNNNQFIGDFDIEYLLTRGGNWRLKAYNHFNDRNLYTRSALTTQGIGIMFKHDFNSPFRRR